MTADASSIDIAAYRDPSLSVGVELDLHDEIDEAEDDKVKVRTRGRLGCGRKQNLPTYIWNTSFSSTSSHLSLDDLMTSR